MGTGGSGANPPVLRRLGPIVMFAWVMMSAWALAPRPAGAASFDCAKAGTATEHAICGHADLDTLDQAMATAYRNVLGLLSDPGGGETALTRALKHDQQVWLRARNACRADHACLAGIYRRRLAVLQFAAVPDDGFSGSFAAPPAAELHALRLDDGRFAVAVSAVEPGQGRWLCAFLGIGQTEAAGGRLRVVSADGDRSELVVERNADGLAITAADAAAVDSRYCGLGGTVAGRYRRAAP